MRLQFEQVDVFTNRPLTGNPLCVVQDGTGLSTVQMQAIAREMNLSEVTFVLPPPLPRPPLRHAPPPGLFPGRPEVPVRGFQPVRSLSSPGSVAGPSLQYTILPDNPWQLPVFLNRSSLNGRVMGGENGQLEKLRRFSGNDSAAPKGAHIINDDE